MISSETSQTEVWIDPGFEAAAMHVCQRFEDNTDRDTGSPRNVSPPPPVQFTWIYKFRSQALPGKISVKVVLFEASCKGGEPSEPGAK